jgi:DNA-binding SARP family transcriptional activator/TolB-like protein
MQSADRYSRSSTEPGRAVPQPPLLEIVLLGPFKVLVDGEPVDERRWQRRKAKTLIKLLAVEPHHQMHREQLAEMLWPELDPETSLANLHKIIHAARRALEPQLQQGARSSFINTEGQQVILCASNLIIDAEVFEQTLSAAFKSNDPNDYEAGLAVYKGDLLIEDPYEDWAAVKREKLRLLYRDSLRRLALLYEQDGRTDLAIARLNELIARDPSNEEAHRTVMRLWARTGKRSQALLQYKLCCEAVRKELDVEPDKSTTELYNRILAGEIGPVSPEVARASSSVAIEPSAGERLTPPRIEDATPNTTDKTPDAISTKRPPARLRRLWWTVSVIVALAVTSLVLLKMQSHGVGAINALAVLPFVNESGDPSLEYFSDGITDSSIASLSQLPGLRVTARLSVFSYKSRHVDPQTIGRELAVNAAVFGRVSQDGERLTVTVELVDASSGERLWTKLYSHDASDLLEIEQEIAHDISARLRPQFGADLKQRAANRGTDDEEAYREYLKGRYQWNKRSPEAMAKAVQHFRRAIELDPTYGLAYAGLADALTLGGGTKLLPHEYLPKARAMAMKALEMDETLAEAHATLGLIAESSDCDFSLAESEFKRALDLNPNYAAAHHWYGEMLAYAGRFDDSLAELRVAAALDPLSLAISRDRGMVLWYARRFDQAVEQLRGIVQFEPAFADAHVYLGLIYQHQGMFEQAIEEFRAAVEFEKNPAYMALIAPLYAKVGKIEESRSARRQVEEHIREGDFSAWTSAQYYANIGDKDQAFKWLEKADEEHRGALLPLKVDPSLDSLRSDPRYADLMRRIGFPN